MEVHMPRKLTLNSLTSDKYAVEQLLKDAIQYGDIVGEIQSRDRLKNIEKEIEDVRKYTNTHASVALFFGGGPVFGSKGILAGFAGHILEDFQELVSKAFASKETGGLGERGKIPLKANSDLMVTQIAKGSFGFILDEVSDQLEITETALKETVEDVIKLIDASAQPEEDSFEGMIEALDNRVLQSLKDFFITLDKANSTMRLVSDDNEFCFDSTRISRARMRTEATQIDESIDIVSIIIYGLLPEHCKFEAIIPNGQIIFGSVTKQAAEKYSPEIIGKMQRVRLLTKSITPIHRPVKKIYKIIDFLA
jgi:hypothetical protein